MRENYLGNPAAFEGVNDVYEGLKKRISTLETENAELKKANKSANELVSIATHQIRGPLTSIRGYGACILEGDYGDVPEKMRTPLNIISRSSETLSRTVNDFLDVSKIELGEMRYYLKDFDLQDLVKEVIEEMKLDIERDGLELRLNIKEGDFTIHSDKTKLKHVMINLIDNAHKYVKSGVIEIGLEHSAENKILFSVKDSGIGMEPETISSLFTKFSRAADASKLNARGTGLGLYIARKIVESRKGRIWAESEGTGLGSTFFIELPA